MGRNARSSPQSTLIRASIKTRLCLKRCRMLAWFSLLALLPLLATSARTPKLHFLPESVDLRPHFEAKHQQHRYDVPVFKDEHYSKMPHYTKRIVSTPPSSRARRWAQRGSSLSSLKSSQGIRETAAPNFGSDRRFFNLKSAASLQRNFNNFFGGNQQQNQYKLPGYPLPIVLKSTTLPPQRAHNNNNNNNNNNNFHDNNDDDKFDNNNKVGNTRFGHVGRVEAQAGPLVYGDVAAASTTARPLPHVPRVTSLKPLTITRQYSTPSPIFASKSPVHLSTEYYPPKQRVMPRVTYMNAECSDDVMKLNVHFNASFQGLIYSAGYEYDPNCVYVQGDGSEIYEFYIELNRCGTLGSSDKKANDISAKNTDPSKSYMWNTLAVQYNPLIEEEWDEHFKVTCEYGYDFWKTVTFPFLDTEINTADPVHFTLKPPECSMEVRHGYGIDGQRVGGPVHVGDPLTLLVNMRTNAAGFDILVNDCVAHNGGSKRISLIDSYGCPVDTKLISKFQGTWRLDTAIHETVLFAHLKTFRFTGTPALYIECDIRMCHGNCPPQTCNWRNPDQKRVKREADFNDTTNIFYNNENDSNKENKESKLSENLRMYQSIHVLQSKSEDEEAAAASVTNLVNEDDVCLGQTLFATILSILALAVLLSLGSMAVLCLRANHLKSSEPDNKQSNEFDVYKKSRGQRGLEENNNYNEKEDNNGYYVPSRRQRIP